MWIVKIALRAPYTFTVLGILLLIGGALSTLQMAKDIFPAINIPVVGIIWTYNGLPSQEMAERITTVSERALTTSVNNIEHIESNSFNGIAVIRSTCNLKGVWTLQSRKLPRSVRRFLRRCRQG